MTSNYSTSLDSDDYVYFDHHTVAVVHSLAGAAIAYATQHLNLADSDEFYRKLFETLNRFQAAPLVLPLPLELTDDQRTVASTILGLLQQAYAPPPPDVLVELGLIDRSSASE